MTVVGEWHDLWATPVLVTQVDAPENYNVELRELILRKDPRYTVGVTDGNKTRPDLLRWDDDLIQPLREWILDAAEFMNAEAGAGTSVEGVSVPMIAEAWAVLYREWGYHHLHAHHDSAWSGVYYVHTGHMAEHAGDIEFLDPRPAACSHESWRSPLQAISPRPGMLLAFPSWLQHWTTPYDGDSERICIAFNVGFDRRGGQQG